ncbi:unnamed protein product [Gongylonema pulchrum]|uniref:Resolvase/invertase-type recombinase catalytic domain-containing protein n=1 Tax=Gongylonema pulchrum TaxID=637853 RepID=A0A183F1J0_9BILA|nr:unnamed protein product [Gongylonema pulchrum]
MTFVDSIDSLPNGASFFRQSKALMHLEKSNIKAVNVYSQSSVDWFAGLPLNRQEKKNIKRALLKVGDRAENQNCFLAVITNLNLNTTT